MEEERPIGLLGDRWDRGLLAMVGWSLVLHVLVAGGVLAVLLWTSALKPRAIPAYTVELMSLSPGGSSRVGGIPGGKRKTEDARRAAGSPGDARLKSKAAEPTGKTTPVRREQAKAPQASAEVKKPVEVEKPAEVKKPVEAKESPEVKKPVEVKKSPEANKVALAKKFDETKKAAQTKDTKQSKETDKKRVAPVKAPAAGKAEPAPAAETKAKTDKKAMEPKKQPSAAGDPTKVADEGRDGQKPTAKGDETLSDEDRYAAAIDGVRRRLEGRGGGAAGEGSGQGAASAGGSGVGDGGRVVGTEFLIYYNIILSHIKQAWLWVGHDHDLSVTVRFAIGSDGEIRNVKLDQSSGDPSYDESVLRAVRKVNPLPPPPAAYLRDFSRVELTFRPGDLREPG